jgi:hypothetical protein
VGDVRTLFAALVSRLQGRERRDLFLHRGTAGLFFGLVPALAAAALAGTFALPLPALPLAAGLAVAGCAAGILSAFLRRVDRRQLLIRADRVLGSRELVSTAFDLVDSEASGLFVEAVLEDAAQLLTRTPPRTIVGRLKLPFAPFAGIALALTIAGLAFPVDLRALFPPRVDPAAELAQIGEDLRQRGQLLADEARARDLGRSLELAQQLAQLGSDLAARRIQQEDALDRMSELEAGLAEEYQLRTQDAQPAVPSGKAGRGGRGSGAGTSGEPGKAGSEEDGQSPEAAANSESASGGAESANADRSLRDLGDTLNKLRQSRRQLEGGGNGDRSQAQSPARPRRPRSSEAQQGSQEIPPGESESARTGRQGQSPGTPQGGSGESGGTEQQGADEQGNGFGTLPAPVKRGDPTSIIQGGRGPGLQAQGNPAEGDSTRLLARALPQWTGAQLPEETIMNTYSRQAESALARDEVPLKLKEYVKEYFTIIGISK